MGIHHATIKRATRLGVELIDNGGSFQMRNIETGLFSDDYDSTAEALEELERGEVEWIEPEEEEEAGASGSVVKEAYHDRYSKNPHGPGCGDGLDIALRDAVMRVFVGEKQARVDLVELRKIGEANNRWSRDWESLNPGMQRMNLANRLRAFLRNHEDAVIELGSSGEGRFGVEYRPAKSKKPKKG